MSRTIVQTITIPEDYGTPECTEPINFMLSAEGVPQEYLVPILLQGAEAYQRQVYLDEYEEEMPMGNKDFIDSAAAMNARLRIIDNIMHLPMVAGQIGINTSY